MEIATVLQSRNSLVGGDMSDCVSKQVRSGFVARCTEDCLVSALHDQESFLSPASHARVPAEQSCSYCTTKKRSLL